MEAFFSRHRESKILAKSEGIERHYEERPKKGINGKKWVRRQILPLEAGGGRERHKKKK